MRIRKPIPNSLPSSPLSSSSPSSSSSSSSSSCSLTSLTNNSLASSTDSSSTSTSNSPLTATRCQGLDLLVKAMYQVTAGSVVGVPYIQKRVITRRRRRVLSFDTLFISECFKKVDDDDGLFKCKGGSLMKRQQRKRLKTVPTKYQDSVLIQSLKPKPKSKRLSRSAKISEELGSLKS